MLNSMTGFGSKQRDILSFGQVRVELRSSNHKFLDIVLHLPEGYLFLEEKIRKTIEARIKRGRVTCVVSIGRQTSPDVFINEELLGNYLKAVRNIRKKFDIKDEVHLDTIMHLPGLISLAPAQIAGENIWPKLKSLVDLALEEFVRMRQKEGRALQAHLNSCVKLVAQGLQLIEDRSRAAVAKKCCVLKTDDERSSFMKDSDISEELKRLQFHVRNFKNKITRQGPLGKELDFIAQEMQREANTIGAKSFDVAVSARVVKIKSQIEKIREQVQNVE